MFKIMMPVALCVCAISSFAECRQLTEEQKKLLAADYQKLSEADRQKRQEAIDLENLIVGGGFMLVPGTPSGSVRIVNEQKKVPSADLAKVIDAFSSLQPYDIKIVDSDETATMKIKIVDDPKAESLSIYPDDRLSVVNVAKLQDEKTKSKPAFLAARVRKQIIRAFSFMTAGSSYGVPLFNGIGSPRDLDKFAAESFPMDVIMRSAHFMGGCGLRAAEEVTYRDVLERGFDIAPTNEYQKAIYDAVKKPVKAK